MEREKWQKREWRRNIWSDRGWKDFNINDCQLWIGTCHQPLQGLNHVGLQLVTLTPPEGVQGKVRCSVLQGIWWDRSFSSVQFSHSVVSDSLRPHESQHARPPCPSLTPGVHSDSFPSSQWCHPAISSSVVPFSFCPQSLPAAESLPMSQLFGWGGQSTGVSALASVLPKNTQDWSPLEWTGWISLQPKGLSRVFSNTTVQKHQNRSLDGWIFLGTDFMISIPASPHI